LCERPITIKIKIVIMRTDTNCTEML
jgi:hypothetical protein